MIRKISTAMYDAGIIIVTSPTVIHKYIEYSFLEKSTAKTKEQPGFRLEAGLSFKDESYAGEPR